MVLRTLPEAQWTKAIESKTTKVNFDFKFFLSSLSNDGCDIIDSYNSPISQVHLNSFSTFHFSGGVSHNDGALPFIHQNVHFHFSSLTPILLGSVCVYVTISLSLKNILQVVFVCMFALPTFTFHLSHLTFR